MPGITALVRTGIVVERTEQVPCFIAGLLNPVVVRRDHGAAACICELEQNSSVRTLPASSASISAASAPAVRFASACPQVEWWERLIWAAGSWGRARSCTFAQWRSASSTVTLRTETGLWHQAATNDPAHRDMALSAYVIAPRIYGRLRN